MNAKKGLLLILGVNYFLLTGYTQPNSFERIERELSKDYSRFFTFYHKNDDSLEYYSDLFSKKLIQFIKNNPATLNYAFKHLEGDCHIVTTSDGSFRIYSWDTWLGGTMHKYKNIYQFKSGESVFVTILEGKEGDMGSYFTGLYSITAMSKKYFIGICGGSESTRYRYEVISAYTVSDSVLNDTIPLIKTEKGVQNAILLEYDFFSLRERPGRPLQLIKYDPDRQILFIPIVMEDGKVTDDFIRYQFTGSYFEKIKTQKKAGKK